MSGDRRPAPERTRWGPPRRSGAGPRRRTGTASWPDAIPPGRHAAIAGPGNRRDRHSLEMEPRILYGPDDRPRPGRISGAGIGMKLATSRLQRMIRIMITSRFGPRYKGTHMTVAAEPRPASTVVLLRPTATRFDVFL